MAHDPARPHLAVGKCDGCGQPQWSDGQSFARYGSHRPRCPWVWLHLCTGEDEDRPSPESLSRYRQRVGT
jgi:hypothetical protein